MTTNLLHQLWNVIENAQPSFLLRLDEQSLVHWLTQQLKERQNLSCEEEAEAKAYIRSKLLLIRDVS